MKGLSHKISWDISFLNTPYWKRFSPSSNLSRNKRREPLLPHLLPESLGFAHSTNSPPPSSLQIPDVPILPPRKVTKYSPEECEAPEEPRPAARPSPVSGALIQGEQKGSKRTGMGKSPELRRGLPAAPRAQPRGSVPNPVPHPPPRRDPDPRRRGGSQSAPLARTSTPGLAERTEGLGAH